MIPVPDPEAKLVYTFENLYLDDTTAVARVDKTAIPLPAHPCVKSVCSDETSATSPGVIERAIAVVLIDGFEQKFPTDEAREGALVGAFLGLMQINGPAVRVTETLTFGPSCFVP